MTKLMCCMNQAHSLQAYKAKTVGRACMMAKLAAVLRRHQAHADALCIQQAFEQVCRSCRLCMTCSLVWLLSRHDYEYDQSASYKAGLRPG